MKKLILNPTDANKFYELFRYLQDYEADLTNPRVEIYHSEIPLIKKVFAHALETLEVSE